jgi:MFS family permease
MRTFLIIWFGQLISTIGSQMTNFAISIWVWELTNSVTAMAWVGLASQLPRIALSLYAGVLVDRYLRKYLMILGNCVTAFSTMGLGILFWADALQIWHIYLVAAVNSSFRLLQGLSYSASVAMLVPPNQYSRATSMNSTFNYGSSIMAPALAGALYPAIGLTGIIVIDLATFSFAIVTLITQSIPQPSTTETEPSSSEPFWQRVTYGIRYLLNHRGLTTLLLIRLLFKFLHDLGGVLLRPLILARTDNNTTVLGWIHSAAGIAGVLSATVLSTRGAPKQKLNGLFSGMIGAGIFKTIFGLGQAPWIWLPAQFGSSLNFPLMQSTSTTIWLNEVNPELQGRVFSVRSLSMQLTSAVGVALAGPLADQVFEPAMMEGGSLTPLLGTIFGTGEGAGMALLYVLCSVGLLVVGIVGQLAWRRWEIAMGWDKFSQHTNSMLTK